MSDPRTILGLDPQRFLSDGDAVAEWRPNDDDRWAGPISPEEWAALLGCPTHPMPYDDMDWVAWFREGADGAGRDGIDRAARAVLDTPTPPMTNDHDDSYEALVHALPNLEIDPTESARLRAMTRGEAA